MVVIINNPRYGSNIFRPHAELKIGKAPNMTHAGPLNLRPAFREGKSGQSAEICFEARTCPKNVRATSSWVVIVIPLDVIQGVHGENLGRKIFPTVLGTIICGWRLELCPWYSHTVKHCTGKCGVQDRYNMNVSA